MQMFIGEKPPKGGIPGRAILRSKARRDPVSGLQEDLQHARPRRLFQRSGRGLEREDGGHEGPDVDAARSEEVERGPEAPAARPDDGDFVHDERRRVEACGAVMGRLPDDRPARTDERERPRDPVRRARRLHDEVERAGLRARRAPEERDLGAGDPEDRSGEPAELSGSENRGAGAGRNRHLVEDLARRRERLREDSLIVRHAVRDEVEIRLGKSQPFRVRARMPADAEDRAPRTVASEPSSAPAAPAAGEVDLADDAAPEEREAGGAFHDADELVARDPSEGVVAALQLEIRAADPREEDADERKARPRRGSPHLTDPRPSRLEEESAHPQPSRFFAAASNGLRKSPNSSRRETGREGSADSRDGVRAGRTARPASS